MFERIKSQKSRRRQTCIQNVKISLTEMLVINIIEITFLSNIYFKTSFGIVITLHIAYRHKARKRTYLSKITKYIYGFLILSQPSCSNYTPLNWPRKWIPTSNNIIFWMKSQSNRINVTSMVHFTQFVKVCPVFHNKHRITVKM